MFCDKKSNNYILKETFGPKQFSPIVINYHICKSCLNCFHNRTEEEAQMKVHTTSFYIKLLHHAWMKILIEDQATIMS